MTNIPTIKMLDSMKELITVKYEDQWNQAEIATILMLYGNVILETRNQAKQRKLRGIIL